MLFRKQMSSKVFGQFEDPVRSELFGADQLENYARELAHKNIVTSDPRRGVNLAKRVSENEDVLIRSFQMIVQAVREERAITPAAEWLIDNFYIVESQLKDIKDHLPPQYYKELPKLADGNFKGFPRIYSIAWEFVAHTDSLFDPELLKLVLKSYQKVQPLTLGELWAISITLRVVMIENLRRLSTHIVGSQLSRAHADLIADEILGLGGPNQRSNEEIIEGLSKISLSVGFAVQFVQRLRFQEGVAANVLEWLDGRLMAEGLIAEKIVQEEHNSQTAANVTVRNIITSMRLMSSLDWREFFEEVSLVDEKLKEHPLYEKMDFFTRDNYRHSLEELSRGSKLSELEVAKALVKKTEAQRASGSQDEKKLDLGYYLISCGRYEFEKEIGFKVKIKNHLLRWYVAHRQFLYLGTLFFLTAFFLSLCLKTSSDIPQGLVCLLVIMGIFPASEVAISIINRWTVLLMGPRHLPRLDLSKNIPPELKTFVVVPTMLLEQNNIVSQVEQLEVHYLSNPDDSVFYALLSDWKDSPSEHLDTDDIFLSIALNQIISLNKKYGPSSDGYDRFYLFHRYRKWNESENKWMGWERKRGKLHEFNRFLRGATDTTYIINEKMTLNVPKDINYIITLDADTKLPRGAVAQLVGTFAHPLNQAKFDEKLNRVVEGFGILQPRITPKLPESEDSTFFQRLSSGPSGIDPYAAAVSDVYQDLFGEGSYIGKGIYNLDVFERALKDRTPENRLLSHDLFEGNFARCALLNDVEFFEDFPSHFQVAMARSHRWIRGDWQLLPWILGRGGRSISLIGRWKMIDNLRRSLLAPANFFLCLFLFFIPFKNIMPWLLLILLSVGITNLLPFLEGLFCFDSKTPASVKFRDLFENLLMDLSRFVLNIIFIPYEAWLHLDAIIRTIIRLGFTKRNLLEWTTSAQTKASASLSLKSFIKQNLGVMVLLSVLILLLVMVNSDKTSIFVPMFVLWFSSPFVAWKISLPPKKEEITPLSKDDVFVLRNSARKIWRFFSTFVTAEENFLPPDNFQEEPAPVIAHRSSPTNFGLYLLSVVTARDFGWIGIHEMVERLENTIHSMETLPRYNGHFYNWYETTDKRALEPRYISSVDNGNLAGHLLAVAQSLEEMAVAKDYADKTLSGIEDSLRLLVEAFSEQSDFLISSVLNDLIKLLTTSYLHVEDKSAHWELLLSRSAFLLDEIKFYGGKKHEAEVNEIHNWANIVEAEIRSHAADFFQESDREKLRVRLIDLSIACRKLVYEMDFSFLYDPTRKLFSIGYRMSDSCLDDSYYDLLASEARLLSLVAVAKGDVPAAHWFRLGRSLTSIKTGAALISWSGSMFEYLMPSLVMQSPASSLLEQTCRLIVKKQIQYAEGYSIPWGMSESAYNTRDLHLTYQYSNFGIPDLAFKRGMGKDLVIAPYATILAGMYDPGSAVKNLRKLSFLNVEGNFGFYESVDFTRSRLPEGLEFSIVKAYMAHHQGMSLISISNIIHDNLMVKRFHREPIIQSSELLLQERAPKNIIVAKTRLETVRVEHVSETGENILRQYFSPHHAVPRVHLLSNGHYSVMINAAGSGYSRFHDLALSRWREDVTRDNWGSYIYLRDIHSKEIWSAAHQPTCIDADRYEVIFTEDRAKILREDRLIASHLEVLVSPEDNAEIRRLSLSNNGTEARVIEVTSYFEVVLNTQGADIAHPTFSNLFVQTEYHSRLNALLATRRPRAETEASIWMAQVISLDSNAIGDIEYETDRARFIGRGRSVHNPLSIETKKLSNTTGSVLDPVMSLRSRVRIEPGATATMTFTTIVSSLRDDLIKLVEKYHSHSSYDRTSNLAWTDAQVKLHYLGIEHREANLFQKLANRLIYLDPSLRVSSDILKKNVQNVTNLWAYGISGDNPIVLLRIDDIEQRSLLRQLLRAHEYWGIKRLVVDLVVLNEKASSYSQELHDVLDSIIKSSNITSGSYLSQSKGKVFLLRSDLISPPDLNLLQTAARAILVGRQGNLAEQVKRMVRKTEKFFGPGSVKTSKTTEAETKLILPRLDFFNGLGGFADSGMEYVIHLKNGENTPLPWINVIANSHFGFHVSERGAGSTWSMNSRENQLTPWTNDPVSDPIGECFYIFDKDSSELWSPTIAPIRVENAEYMISHGQGYSQFTLRNQGIKSLLTQFVHFHSPVKISKLVLTNETNRERNLSITSYVDWVLGFNKTQTSTYIVTEYNEKNESLLSFNPWSQEFGKRVSFAKFIGGNDSWTADRTEFIGRNASLYRPEAFLRSSPLGKKAGAGMDSCAALRKDIVIPAKGEVSVVFLLGQTESALKTEELIEYISAENIENVFTEVLTEWNHILGKIQVETPDQAMNIMLNRWLLYQTTVCRLWSRSAFYQAGGAFGFRDQLQDSMAVIWTKPEMIRGQILRAASRQFIEGDVQHWWHMPTGRGVRTHFSDDLLWLPFVVSYYLHRTKDYSVLDVGVPFLNGPILELEKEDSYYTPEITAEKASVYEHCARALDRSLAVGVHGLPLMGGGDWNDGMNRVGHMGKGESVWLAWFLIYNLSEFTKIAESRGEESRAAHWREHQEKLKDSIENEAWDGDWYRRAFYDDGTPLGSAKNSECRIDSLAQTWGVISNAGDRGRAELAMRSVEKHLVKKDEMMVLLFTPPFDKTTQDPGYIKGYIPGVRENGGQYTHAAIWCILAYAGLDNGQRAVEIFKMINPINHSLTKDLAHIYKVEPYVIAADVYSQDPHAGRGGWTWYTGSAGWMYTAGIESILGFKISGNVLTIDPRIHPEWKSYKIVYRHYQSTYKIDITNPKGLSFGRCKISLDGKSLDEDMSKIKLVDDQSIHHVIVELI